MKKLIFFLALSLSAQVSSTNGTIGNTIPGRAAGGATIPATTSTLAGDGAGGAQAVTGTATDCVKVNGTSGACGTGSVSGPVSSTDRAIATWNSTTGAVLRDSSVIIDASSNVTGAASVATGDGTLAGLYKMLELTANGSNFRSWLVPDTLTADLTLKFADAVPTANQVMRFSAPSSNVSTQSWASVSDNIRAFGYSFDGGGTALTAGVTGYLTVPYACTIAAWNISVDAGTATVDLWKIATGTAVPTISNTITASAIPAISTGTSVHSTTLTGWTTTVTANDIVAVNLKVTATASFVNLTVQCNQ